MKFFNDFEFFAVNCLSFQGDGFECVVGAASWGIILALYLMVI
jgi:hypothetical protein